jgi:hypothetical protein
MIKHKDSLKCILTGSRKFKKIFSLKKFPIYLGVVKKKFKCEFLDLNFLINRLSGTVQIYPRVNLKKLYFKSHGSGSVGETWKKHHSLFFNVIFKYLKGNIIEVGGGSNSIGLAGKINTKKNIKIYTFDPTSSLRTKDNLKVIRNFFSEKELSLNKVKKNSIFLVVHSHVAEHMYDIKNFFLLIHKYLSNDDGYHIFSIPNMEAMIKQGFSNAVNFEHPVYLNERLVDKLLYVTNFKIIKKKYFKKDHSIFYITKKICFSKKKEINKNFLKKMYISNYKIFLNFFDMWNKDVKNINKTLKIENRRYYLFGAHIFSQFLIKFGLNLKNVICILDNDPFKKNFYLYGTKLRVLSPNILRNKKNPLILMRAAQYSNEIKKQILNNINPSVKFI